LLVPSAFSLQPFNLGVALRQALNEPGAGGNAAEQRDDLAHR
jgi:hypothetical protein